MCKGLKSYWLLAVLLSFFFLHTSFQFLSTDGITTDNRINKIQDILESLRYKGVLSQNDTEQINNIEDIVTRDDSKTETIVNLRKWEDRERALQISVESKKVAIMNATQLAAKEHHYSAGQVVKNIPCPVGQCKGADRMLAKHRYGPCYAEFIQKMRPTWLARADQRIVVGEVGILTGSGLAIWADVFPEAEIHGFDFNITNTQLNLKFLKRQGAFKSEDPQLHPYNQLRPIEENVESIRSALQSKRFTFFADDALHTDQAIIDTFLAFKDFMLPDGLYVIEDVKPPAVVKNCMGAFQQCVDRAFKVFRPVADKHGWSMFSCKSDAMWYAFTRKPLASAHQPIM